MVMCPREIPFDGEPADVAAVMNDYGGDPGHAETADGDRKRLSHSRKRFALGVVSRRDARTNSLRA